MFKRTYSNALGLNIPPFIEFKSEYTLPYFFFYIFLKLNMKAMTEIIFFLYSPQNQIS